MARRAVFGERACVLDLSRDSRKVPTLRRLPQQRRPQIRNEPNLRETSRRTETAKTSLTQADVRELTQLMITAPTKTSANRGWAQLTKTHPTYKSRPRKDVCKLGMSPSYENQPNLRTPQKPSRKSIRTKTSNAYTYYLNTDFRKLEMGLTRDDPPAQRKRTNDNWPTLSRLDQKRHL